MENYDEEPQDEAAAPESERAPGEPMSAGEFQTLVTAVIADAADFVDNVLGPERAEAEEYYNAEPFGDEEDGRSKVVLSEVRDTITGLLPSCLKVIFGPEGVVEFVPRRLDQIDQAKQATDWVRYMFEEENGGFLQTHSVLKDGMLKRLGIFTWGWDDAAEVKAGALENVSAADLEVLVQQPGFTLTRASENADGTTDIEYTVAAPEGKAWVRAVPPEEFLFSREARGPKEFLFMGHRRRLSEGELLALGIPEKVLEAAKSDPAGGDALASNEEAIARLEASTGSSQGDPDAGDANEKIEYVEGVMRADFDGDGVAELRKVCTVGPRYTVVRNVPTSEVRFSFFTPDPIPHALQGSSIADRTKDVQKIKSALLRSALDSFSAALFPRPEYVEGEVAIEDVLNTDIGAPIRVTRPGMLNMHEVPFTGDKAFAFLEYMDSVKEQRTGHNAGAMGLDADALQSSTKQAVNAAVSASQEQKELMVRIFAEQAMKPMFRGLYRLLMEHKPQQQVARLRGKWVQVTPDAWNADMDVRVTVALGTGLTEEKILTLQGLLEWQMNVLAMAGFNQPLVTPFHVKNTVADMLELRGRPDFSRYIADVPPDWQPPQPQTPPSDAQIAAEAAQQIERVKMIKEFAIKDDELGLKRQDLALRQREQDLLHQRELHKISLDAELRRHEMNLKYQVDISAAQLAAEEAAQKHALEGAKLAHAHVKHEDEMDARMMEHQHDRAVAAREQDRADEEVAQQGEMMDMQGEGATE